MTVSEQTLVDMHEDLVMFIDDEIKERKMRARDVVVRNTNFTDKCYKDYNTCVTAIKPFGFKYTMFVNLDNTYDKQDIRNLSNKFSRFLVTSMNKDAFQLSTLSEMIQKKHPNELPGNVFQLALKEFQKMRKEQGEE